MYIRILLKSLLFHLSFTFPSTFPSLFLPFPSSYFFFFVNDYYINVLSSPLLARKFIIARHAALLHASSLQLIRRVNEAFFALLPMILIMCGKRSFSMIYENE